VIAGMAKWKPMLMVRAFPVHAKTLLVTEHTDDLIAIVRVFCSCLLFVSSMAGADGRRIRAFVGHPVQGCEDAPFYAQGYTASRWWSYLSSGAGNATSCPRKLWIALCSYFTTLFLHLSAAPQAKKAAGELDAPTGGMVGMTPDQMLNAMMPPPRPKSGVNTTQTMLKFPLPSSSVALGAALIEEKPKTGPNVFQIVEQVQGKMWGESKRTVMIRAPDASSLGQWMSNLQELCPLHMAKD
jgi:hypothetical protein